MVFNDYRDCAWREVGHRELKLYCTRPLNVSTLCRLQRDRFIGANVRIIALQVLFLRYTIEFLEIRGTVASCYESEDSDTGHICELGYPSVSGSEELSWLRLSLL